MRVVLDCVVFVMLVCAKRQPDSKSAVEFEGGQCVFWGNTGWREWARRTEDHRRRTDKGGASGEGTHP